LTSLVCFRKGQQLTGGCFHAMKGKICGKALRDCADGKANTVRVLS